MYAYSAYCLVPDLSNKTHFCFTVNFKWIFLCTCYRFLGFFFMFTISLPVTSFYLVSTKNLYNLYQDEQISTYLQHKMPPWISLCIMSAVLHVLEGWSTACTFFLNLLLQTCSKQVHSPCKFKKGEVTNNIDLLSPPRCFSTKHGVIYQMWLKWSESYICYIAGSISGRGPPTPRKTDSIIMHDNLATTSTNPKK